MRIEHTGYMVEDPPSVAEWYVRHLGFHVARKLEARPFTTFLVAGDGQGMLEIYNNPAASVPDYGAQNPLVLHLAFDVGDEPITAARDRLSAAGATIASDLVITASGDRLVMLRDPWGLAVQLVQRKEALR